MQAVPASKGVLCQFVSHLAREGLKHGTITVYLSAVCFLHVAEWTGDPFHPTLHRLWCICKESRDVRLKAVAVGERVSQ